ncbi:MAG: Gfo/Idh/MocA family oxidoreductase [Elusimicrobiota bacterium]
MKLRIGVIGAGRMAQSHLDVLASMPDVEIAALASRGAERRDAACARYRIGKAYQDHREMLDREKPDAVIVAVSVADNYEVARDCLQRGVHSLIEKPPGLSSAEAANLLKIAESAKALHMVGLQRRFLSHLQTGLRLLRERGPVLGISVEAPELFGPIKEKKKFPEHVLAKWMFANGIHLLDLMCFVGGDILSVASRRYWIGETIHPDSLHTMVEFAGSCVGHYHSIWPSPGPWSLRVYGVGCKLIIEPLEEGRIVYADKTSTTLPIDPRDADFKPGLYAQDRHFLDACASKTQPGYPAANLREAVTAMRLIEDLVDPSRPWA